MSSDDLWLAENVAELRSAGKYAEAFEALATEHMNSEWVHLAFRHHFLGHRDGEADIPCMLIEFARKSREQNPSVIRDIIQKHFPAQKNAKSRGSLWELWPTDELRILLEARLKLINAFLDFENNAEDRITGLIDEAIQLYERAWPGCAPTSVADKSLSEPAFLRSPGLKRWEKVFREVEERARKRRAGGSSPSWDHPGLLMAGETVLYLQGDSPELPRKGNAVETWVLLAYPIPATSASGDDVSIPEGLLARLVVKTVAGGSGYLFPDPRYGYLPTDKSFEQGLRNVMQVIRRRHAGLQVDFRWRLTPLAPWDRSELPVPVKSIRGRSAEAAFACAIRGAIEGKRLDSHIAITACFREPGAEHETLAKVEGLSDKIVGLRPPAADKLFPAKFEAIAKRHFIDQILVTRGQNGVDKEQRIDLSNRNIRLTPITTFDDAYRKLAHDCQITDAVKQSLRKRATKLLAATCDPYVTSPLSHRKPGFDDSGRPIEKRVPLTKDECAALVEGRLPENGRRILILADSGYGKTSLLTRAEEKIASRPGDCLPLRVGAGPREFHESGRFPLLPTLSSIGWTSNLETCCRQLCADVLGKVIPDEYAAEGPAWLKRQIEKGDVVFLLDSTDQTSKALHELGTFLAASPINRCPTLMTGRPETREYKDEAYQHDNWDIVWVDELGEGQVREFCGDAAISDRLWGNTYWPNEDWRPLVTIPILLKQLRQLARDEKLTDLKNREAVYHATLKDLMQHGKNSLSSAAADAYWTIQLARIERVLAEAAWWTINLEDADSTRVQENFTARLEGNAFVLFQEQFEKKYGTELQTLWQLDLATLAYVEGEPGATSLAWRHASFCEWFAGLYLASLSLHELRSVLVSRCSGQHWSWVVRFALSASQRSGNSDIANRLAGHIAFYWGIDKLMETIRSDCIYLGREVEKLYFGDGMGE